MDIDSYESMPRQEESAREDDDEQEEWSLIIDCVHFLLIMYSCRRAPQNQLGSLTSVCPVSAL
jgi:hypothetical protein